MIVESSSSLFLYAKASALISSVDGRTDIFMTPEKFFLPSHTPNLTQSLGNQKCYILKKFNGIVFSLLFFRYVFKDLRKYKTFVFEKEIFWCPFLMRFSCKEFTISRCQKSFFFVFCSLSLISVAIYFSHRKWTMQEYFFFWRLVTANRQSSLDFGVSLLSWPLLCSVSGRFKACLEFHLCT